MTATEATQENRFVRYAKGQGFECLKLRIDGQDGFPDRTILTPGGEVLFVEFKRTSKDKLRPQQRKWKKKLESLGFKVCVARSFEEAQDFLESP